MAIIYTYPKIANSDLDTGDLVVITDVSDSNKTKQVTVQGIVDKTSAVITKVDSISTTDGTYIDLDPAGPVTGNVTLTADLSATNPGGVEVKDVWLNGSNQWLTLPFDVFKQVCTPIANAATGGDAMPNNTIDWFYNNAALNKWTFTSNNPIVKAINIGTGRQVQVEVLISAGTEVANNIEWSLRMYDNVGNYYQLAASTGEPGPNNIGQPLQSNGPTLGGSNFTACVRQTRIANVDIKTNFFDANAVDVGELELWIRNAGTGGSIITACNVNLFN
jgi:hypothetical protein